ncbi:hypothetical protein ATANTOWER_007878 [Ataeniobius toweri]|uniref:Uncharacterized protein n=1 Tax=Ataeniobius toweri TaxID=208326 RepID=A0ABU7CFU6_9TELE|nr:hypothetical protein [Ataeniobius toweri]
MVRGALETISSRESPFQSCLQPSRSRTTSWEHLSIAHLSVHPPTRTLKHNRATPGSHRRNERTVLHSTLSDSLPQQASITQHHDDPDPVGSSSRGLNPNCLHNQTVKTLSCPVLVVV